MLTFKPFCLCFVDYGHFGTAWKETDDAFTQEKLVQAIVDNDLEGVQLAVMIYPDKAPEDVTQEVADEVIGYDDLTADALDFCAAFGSPSTRVTAERLLKLARNAHDAE